MPAIAEFLSHVFSYFNDCLLFENEQLSLNFIMKILDKHNDMNELNTALEMKT